jgi:hypothetical protein
MPDHSINAKHFALPLLLLISIYQALPILLIPNLFLLVCNFSRNTCNMSNFFASVYDTGLESVVMEYEVDSMSRRSFPEGSII